MKVGVNGVALNYEILGDAEQEVLFIHGYAVRSTGRLYQSLFDILAKHFRIIALDLRGHGGSIDVPPVVTFDQFKEDILQTIEVLKLRKPILVGHSLGALAGLAAAADSPELFKCLALVAPACVSGQIATPPGVIENALRDHRNHEAMRANYRAMYVHDVAEAHLDEVVEAACILDPALNDNWLRVQWPTVDVTSQLQGVDLPMLFVNGAMDSVISPEEQHKMALMQPRCKKVMYTDEGHMLPLEAPERVAREIIRFYQDEFCGPFE